MADRLASCQKGPGMHSLPFGGDDNVLLAYKWNGQPLQKKHGGLARIIMPMHHDARKGESG